MLIYFINMCENSKTRIFKKNIKYIYVCVCVCVCIHIFVLPSKPDKVYNNIIN